MNPMDQSKDEYVISRFMGLPKETIDYLDLASDDSKAVLEAMFRLEYFVKRGGALQGIVLELYRKLQAAKIVIARFSEDVDGEIGAVIKDPDNGLTGDLEIPLEF